MKFKNRGNQSQYCYLEIVDKNYPDHFKTLNNIPYWQLHSSKSAIPCKSFWFGLFIFFFQLKESCKTFLTSSVVQLACFNLFLVLYNTKVYSISAMIWLPILLFFFPCILWTVQYTEKWIYSLWCSVSKVCGIYHTNLLEILVQRVKSMIQKLIEINGRLSIKFSGPWSSLFVIIGWHFESCLRELET